MEINSFEDFLTVYDSPKQIPLYPNYYINRMGHLFDANGVRIEPYTYKNQYHLVYIRDINNKPHTVGIHQLVAMTYDPNWFPGCVVHHIDENKYNNIDQNLISTSRSSHAKIHNPYKYTDVVMTCQICGKNFVWTKERQHEYYSDLKYRSHKLRYITCSRSCSSYIARMHQLGRPLNLLYTIS